MEDLLQRIHESLEVSSYIMRLLNGNLNYGTFQVAEREHRLRRTSLFDWLIDWSVEP